MSGPGPSKTRRAPLPEECLRDAVNAESPAAKESAAARGLALVRDDPELRCLLLRQVFLAEFETERYEEALSTAESMIELGELADVARQDAARACTALGDPRAAAGHLRIAARICPASRRAFHQWCLGSLLYLEGDYAAAVAALTRAARWATTHKPLYEAQLELARLANGDTAVGLEGVRARLANSPSAQGYGELVLGELSFSLGDVAEARHYLTSFVNRLGEARPAKIATLATELRRARLLLARLGPHGR